MELLTKFIHPKLVSKSGLRSGSLYSHPLHPPTSSSSLAGLWSIPAPPMSHNCIPASTLGPSSGHRPHWYQPPPLRACAVPCMSCWSDKIMDLRCPGLIRRGSLQGPHTRASERSFTHDLRWAFRRSLCKSLDLEPV